MTDKKTERIALLDIVRGVAILGILLMNIRLFSEPYAAYFNPKAFGLYAGLDALWFHFQFMVADQKFMAIFSMLFGASTAIICDGLMRRGNPVAVTFAKRNFGLLLIGAAHAYLLWHGDILVPYALASIVPFLFRNARWYISGSVGLLVLLVGSYFSYEGYISISEAPEHIQQLLEEQMWAPSADAIANETAAFTGNWLAQMPYRVGLAFHFETDTFLAWGFWRISGLMLLGLALYRSGFLKGKLSGRTYGVIAFGALAAGYALVYSGLHANIRADWTFPYSMLLANLWNYWGSILVATGYMALFGFLLTATTFRFGFASFANVGKAALTNYLLQSVLCTLLFYGHGLGWYGDVVRIETVPIILGVWIFQLSASNWWFARHEKGPIEALWHRFTYSKWLPTSS